MNSIFAMDAPSVSILGENCAQRNINRPAVGVSGIPVLSTRLLANRSSSLQEIYDLRLDVWEHSGKTEFVNRRLFPNGWFDELDATALHWITTNEKNQIVAAARLNLFNTLGEFPYYDSVSHLSFPFKGTFAFFSRLVVHPDFRSMGLSKQLYDDRMQYCIERKVNWSQVFINNPYVIGLFEAEGFANVGKAEVSYHPVSPTHPVNVFVRQNKLV